MFNKIIYGFAFCFAAASFLPAAAQDIIWAGRVTAVSSEAGSGTGAYAASQVLKAPDVKQLGRLSTQAWHAKRENSIEEKIEVSFPKSEQIGQIIVVESFNPGAVTLVEAIDTRGVRHTVYTNDNPGPLPVKYRALAVKVPLTTYRVIKVAVTLNCSAVNGPNQIDAIGITSEESVDVISDVENKKLLYDTVAVNLGTGVNSKFTELRPVIAPNGKTLYFSRQYHPHNLGGKNDGQDIWVSENTGNQTWGLAKNMGGPLNNKDNTGVCSVTPDNNTLLLINTYNPDGSMQPEGASISYRTKEGWSFPTKLIIQDYYNQSKEVVDYFLANNSKVLLMSVKRKDSHGDQDLYVSFLQKFGVWSKPLNLGPVVNTAKGDFAPFLASDNKTLYFASEGHGGYGKADVFYTKRLDDTWKNWSKPLNLGPPINSKDFDAYYTMSAAADYAYFVSSRDGTEGSRDIFRIALQESSRPEAVMFVSGRVIDVKTKMPMQARISYQNLNDGTEVGTALSDPVNGHYSIVLPKGVTYSFSAEAVGFIGVNENIEVSDTIGYSEINRDLMMVPIEVGQKVQLNNIFFAQSEYYLRNTSFAELDRLVKLLKDNPGVEILVEGHTDNQGNASLNLQLSIDRVNEVKKYLVSKGIDRGRIETKGWGGQKPLASNAREESRKLNRRVEFTIMKK